jgi:hypothetical protein
VRECEIAGVRDRGKGGTDERHVRGGEDVKATNSAACVRLNAAAA